MVSEPPRATCLQTPKRALHFASNLCPPQLMSNLPLLQETEAFLHHQIPLTRAMRVHVESYDNSGLVLTAPLAPNHNHLGTAFGGSLATLATLAGYTLLWLELDDRGSHIVIQESQIRYRRPVRGDLRAMAPRIGAAALAAFRKAYEKTGKARIRLPIHVVSENKVCVEFHGIFVALHPRAA